MIKIDIDIPKDMGIEITPRQLEAARVNAAEVVMETVRENFLRRGGRRYWLEAADAVTIKHGGKDTLVVNIAHRGVALHYYGGTVRPTKSKLLALPAAPDMTEYARSVPGLMLVPIKGRPHLRGLLVKSESGEAKRKWKNKPAGRGIQRPVIGADGKLEVKYTLVDETPRCSLFAKPFLSSPSRPAATPRRCACSTTLCSKRRHSK